MCQDWFVACIIIIKKADSKSYSFWHWTQATCISDRLLIFCRFHRVDEPDRQHAAIIAVEQINQRILGSQNLNLENKASESFAHSPEDNTSYTDKFTPLIQDKLASFQQRDTTRKQSEDVSPSVQTVFESKQYKTDVRAPKTSPDPTVENGVRLYSIAGIPVYRFNNTPEEQNSSRKIDQAVRSDREPPSTAWQDIPETSSKLKLLSSPVLDYL